MLRSAVLLAILILAILPVPAVTAEEPLNPLHQWPQWRGPLGTGVAPHGNPPEKWGENANVRWKTPIPGKGHSTPVIWGDRIFLTTAVPYGDEQPAPPERDAGAHHNVPASHQMEFVALAVNRRDGQILWRRTLRRAQPHEGTHATGSWASASPVTDGERLFVSFGSEGLYALDLDGNTLWEVDLGDMTTRHGHGEGSSPALHGDTLVVNWDHQGDSFTFALDAATGKIRWKKARDEITSWSTPVIVDVDGKPQVIVSATGHTRGYDLATGDEIWWLDGLSRNVVSSPVAGDGLVFVSNSYDWQMLQAIRLAGAHGDLRDTDSVAWFRGRDTPYVPTPVLWGDLLCYNKHLHGVITCVNAKNGHTLFGPQRLEGIRQVFASPVGAGKNIYLADRSGSVVVFRKGAPYRQVAFNRLDDSFSASPAVVGDELFLRGEKSLYCIAEEAQAAPAKPVSR